MRVLAPVCFAAASFGDGLLLSNDLAFIKALERIVNARAALVLTWICLFGSAASAAPPKMSLYHFDVNTGDATLLVTPGGRGVLIDAGDRGRGINPILEFLARAKLDGFIRSLDYTIATHYDADHIGGMDEVLSNGWYPAVAAYDRGNTLLPSFDREYVVDKCEGVNLYAAEEVAPWGQPTEFCPAESQASCQIIEYFMAAQAGGKRKTLVPGQRISLDHGITLDIVVVNATDPHGNTVDISFPGRRDDCASNDLSVGVLISYGDFRYLVAGDLTGVSGEGVADVEGLIADDLDDLDMYHVNHHGSNTSSSNGFMAAIHPTVAIVSNGRMHNHPLKTVVDGRILSLSPPPAIYLTNFNHSQRAWSAGPDSIADDNFEGFDGTIEVAVWQRSFRVYRWRNGRRLDDGKRYLIKLRNS